MIVDFMYSKFGTRIHSHEIGNFFVYWNLFAKGVTEWSIGFHRTPVTKCYIFFVYFGIGELVISFR